MSFFFTKSGKIAKESHQQKTDMHTIHICIGGNHIIVISQIIIIFFNIQGMLQEVKLFVLIYNFFG